MDIVIILGILAALGIVGATAWAIVRVVFHADRRPASSDLDVATVASLRDEVAALRETCTQFDLSIEHAVQRLEERVARVEQRSIQAPATVQADAPVVTAGRE